MAGSYHGQVHEENLKRLEEFHQVSKKNRYRKCLVTCSEKNPKGRNRGTGISGIYKISGY